MEKRIAGSPQPSIFAASNKSFWRWSQKMFWPQVMLYIITEKGKTITQNVSYK